MIFFTFYLAILMSCKFYKKQINFMIYLNFCFLKSFKVSQFSHTHTYEDKDRRDKRKIAIFMPR